MKILTILIILSCSLSLAEPFKIESGQTVTFYGSVDDDTDDNHTFVFKGLDFKAEKIITKCIEVPGGDEVTQCMWKFTYSFKKSDIGNRKVEITVKDDQGKENSVGNTEVKEYIVTRGNYRPKLGSLGVNIVSGGGGGDE